MEMSIAREKIAVLVGLGLLLTPLLSFAQTVSPTWQPTMRFAPQDSRNPGARAHSSAQSPRLGSWPRDDPDTHPGSRALAQEQNGEKVHGIAKAHSAVAAVTYTSFGLAFLSVAIKF